MTVRICPQKVWCPAIQDMVTVIGSLQQLANGLKEFQVKECTQQKTCKKIKHGHYDCLVKKRLEGKF